MQNRLLDVRADVQALRALLERCRTVAVIGAKDKPGQPVDAVGRYLMHAGYTLFPVHPRRRNVWGLETYPALADIPVPVDLVNVFRAPELCAAHAEEALALAPKPLLFWMQLGIASAEAARVLADQGVFVVEDACLMVEHKRLCSGRQ